MIINKGDIFTAKDNLNRTFTYEHMGNIENDSMGNIKLYNYDTQDSTIVEDEWFNQRVIKILC